MSMQVNEFEKFHEYYKFSQQCTGFHAAMYMLEADDLVSAIGEYNQKADALHITCKLKNGMELWLTVINVSGSEAETGTEGFYEADVYEVFAEYQLISTVKEENKEELKMYMMPNVKIKFEQLFADGMYKII